jgi:hypothetical protein
MPGRTEGMRKPAYALPIIAVENARALNPRGTGLAIPVILGRATGSE